MIETKILLTINLEGVLGPRSENAEVIPYNIVTFEGQRANGINYHYPRQLKSCVKKMNISSLAYDYFISTDIPSWYKSRKWLSLSTNERLMLHLNQIAEGKNFTFEILED